MIVTGTFYAVKCDNCGELNENYDGYSFWSDESETKEMASESDWINENGKDYCPDCYEYDNEDNLILKQCTTEK